MPELPTLLAVEREIGLRGTLHDFTKIVWPYVEPAVPFVDNWHIEEICTHYEACLKGEIKELVVNVPPGCSKSKLTCVIFPVWCWIRRPALRWLFASFDQRLVNRDASNSLECVQSDWFKARWGDRLSFPDICPVEYQVNSATGWRLATTPGGKATGNHPNFQIIDDPMKPADLTKQKLANVAQWLSQTMATRWLKAGKETLNCRILIMQRLHCDDLAKQMIDNGAVHLCLPMEYKSVTRCVTPWGGDRRLADGDLLCPERFNAEAVAELRKRLGGMDAAAQLDQNPVPEGGAVFKKVDMQQYWTVLPERTSQWIISVDCAFKGTGDSDYVVIQVWCRKGPNFYLVDQSRERCGFAETVSQIRRTRRRWPKVLTTLIEDKANGPAVIETLKKDLHGILAVNPQGGKESRANAVGPLFEAGNVVLPDPEMKGYEWVGMEFIPEFLSFPRGAHDDQVDCATQALTYLHSKKSYLTEAMKAPKGLKGVTR